MTPRILESLIRLARAHARLLQHGAPEFRERKWNWLDSTRFSPRVVESGVNISCWKRGEHGKRKCVQKQQPAIYNMVLVQTGPQIHMDFDGQSSKAQSANLIPTLATRMSGNGTWDGMEGRQHRFLLLSLSDGQIRSNVKMPLRWSFCTRPISNGLQMTKISWEEFQRDLKLRISNFQEDDFDRFPVI